MRFLRLVMLILLFVSIFTALSGHIFIAWGLWFLLGVTATVTVVLTGEIDATFKMNTCAPT